jgi:hypothetical protein
LNPSWPTFSRSRAKTRTRSARGARRPRRLRGNLPSAGSEQAHEGQGGSRLPRLCRARVAEELQRRRVTRIGEHLKMYSASSTGRSVELARAPLIEGPGHRRWAGTKRSGVAPHIARVSIALDQCGTFRNAAKGPHVALHWLLRCDPERLRPDGGRDRS